MSFKKPLSIDCLYKPCRSKDFRFKTTRSLQPLDQILGQKRAQDAVHFAISMPDPGYNIYAVGSNGLGKRTMMLNYLKREGLVSNAASDWCYVANFEDPRSPRVIQLPAGVGQSLKKDMEQLMTRLQKAIPQAFDNESYYERAELIKSELGTRQEKALAKIAKEAKKHNVQLTVTTPGGYRLIATDGEKPYSVETFAQLPEAKKQEFEEIINKLEKKLRTVLRQLSMLEQEYADKQQQLNEEVALAVSEQPLSTLIEKYQAYPNVVDFLQKVQADILTNVDVFLEEGEEQSAMAYAALDKKVPRRYQVNLLVHQGKNGHSPIVVEENPSYYNLFGYVENLTYKGTVFTDFTLIRPGALHRANGGYLLMDAVKVLEQPFVWDGLKRALRSQQIAINTLERELTLSGTISLEPQPIPLNVKIILFGDRDTYLLLQQYDPEFMELFKVVADFEREMPRTTESQQQYARFIAGLAHDKGLRHCDRNAVMRIIEYAARAAEDQNKLSLHAADIANLLRESDYWAKQAGSDLIRAEHVDQALSSAEYRASRIRDQVFEGIRDGTTLIDTRGEKVGQINALSVLSTGDHEFGMPNRVTATYRYGDGEIIDIERDVALSGAIHSKGMMILSAFLASTFGKTAPLKIAASLTFEQSYSEVDGDSASMAEFCALISAISGRPIQQRFAITGSMNQFGQAQPVGGVNEKIEGFFETCEIQGLTGDQGVIIPRTNVHNLMLKEKVIAAAKEKKFAIYAVDTVLEALQLLTGMTIGKPNDKGRYAKNTLFGEVQARLDLLREYERKLHR